MSKADLKRLPAIHKLQNHPLAIQLMKAYQIDLPAMTDCLKKQLAFIRQSILSGKQLPIAPDSGALIDYIFQ